MQTIWKQLYIAGLDRAGKAAGAWTDVPSCGACLSNMAVTPDGKVVPCQSWLSGENFGKMGVTRWKKIWNHPDCKARRMETAQMKQECPLRGKAEMTR